MTLHSTARQYRDAGLSVIPCRNKRPTTGTWSQYQADRPTDEQLDHMFSGHADQIAVICGAVSGGLEVIDFDLKNDTTGTLWDRVWSDIVEYFNGAPPLVVVNTKSGGVHLYYRCTEIAGNQKLARLAAKAEAVIETRGEGGYVIAPPSAGYSFLPGSSVEAIPTIEPDSRQDILDICRRYNADIVIDRPKHQSVKSSAYKETPWDAYNADTDEPWAVILADAGWTESHTDREGRIHYKRPGSENPYGANWDPTRRLFYVWTTSTEFESGRAYPPSSIYAILRCGGDFSEAAKQLRKAGYGKPFTETDQKLIAKGASLFGQGLTAVDVMRMLTQDWIEANVSGGADLDPGEQAAAAEAGLHPVIEAAERKAKAAKGMFWEIQIIGKRPKIVINKRNLVHFLRDLGYRLLVDDLASNLYRLIHIDADNHLVKEVAFDTVKKDVEAWAEQYADELDVDPDGLLEAIINLSKDSWNDVITWMHRVSITDLDIMRDTADTAYIPFRNGVVRVTSDEPEIIPYRDLPPGMLVWQSQIIPRDIELFGFPEYQDNLLNESAVYRFFKRIAGIGQGLEHLTISELGEVEPALQLRFLAFVTSMGYLLHNHKDPSRTWAILMAEDTASDKDGGGAGKDLARKCLEQVRGVSRVDGRNWRTGTQFAFQTYKLGDDILYLEDIDKHFNYESMHVAITGGLIIEKKNRDAMALPPEKSPKVLGSTNYAPNMGSEHLSRRWVLLLLTKYFGKARTVEDEFGQQFWGPAWTARDWNLFYYVMFTMIQTYLSEGLIRMEETRNMKEKMITSNYGADIHDYLTELAGTGGWVAKNDAYDGFLEDSGQDKKQYSMRRFTAACEAFAQAYGLTYIEKKQNIRSQGGLRDQRKYLIFQRYGVDLPAITDAALLN